MLVSNVTGLPLEEAITTLVFNPWTTYHLNQLGATEFGIKSKKNGSRVGLQLRLAERNILFADNTMMAITSILRVTGHAGIFADVPDVLALGRLMPNTSLFHRVLKNLHDWGGGRGYGVQFGDLYPDNGFGHTGFTGTYLYVNPLRDLVVVVLTNRLHTSNVRSINHIRIEAVKRLLVR